MPAGRPSIYTQELAHRICQRIAEGERLRSICKDDDMPARSTVFAWALDREDFRTLYARAMDLRLECEIEDLQDIADDGSNDWMERQRKDGSVEQVLDREHVERSKIRIAARQWIAERLKPQKYAVSRDVKISGTVTLAELISAAAGATQVPENRRLDS